MLKKSIKPEAIVYNLMIEIATLAKDKELINELVSQMWEERINIHPQVYDSIHQLEDLANQNKKSND